VGLITVDFDAMELPAQPGLTITAYTAVPGTPDHDALQLLAAWGATEDAQHADQPTAPSHQTAKQSRLGPGCGARAAQTMPTPPSPQRRGTLSAALPRQRPAPPCCGWWH